jgi:hypothetical protein
MSHLRETLSSEQMALLCVVFRPFDATGEWPVWQYLDPTLEAMGIDAEATLDSLPMAGTRGSRSLWRLCGTCPMLNLSSGHSSPRCAT